jgi:60 kDa SS-A/Ro ribonucleoprotein
MLKCVSSYSKIQGKTVLLIDVSGSMDWALGKKEQSISWSTRPIENEVSRIDVASGLAILLNELCEDVQIYTFSGSTVAIPSTTKGFKLKDAIYDSQEHGGTYLNKALRDLENIEYDRLIVITDEQVTDKGFDGFTPKNQTYVVNVAPYEHGIGYGDGIIHIDGFSEEVINWIQMYENESRNHWRSEIEEILFSEVLK